MQIPIVSDSSSNQRQVIQASEILAKIERGEVVEYYGFVIEGDLDLSILGLPTEHVDRTEIQRGLRLSDELKVISSQITINDSEIRGKVNFGNAHFQKMLSFKGAQFDDYAYFGGAKFGGYADFDSARFYGYAYFKGVQFDGNTYFRETQFDGIAGFGGVEFGGDVYFKGAKFDRNAIFGLAHFCGYAYFRGAQFTGDAGFGGAEFNGDTAFWGVQFSGNVGFGGTRFGGYVGFGGTQFAENVSFNDTKFSDPTSQEMACRIAKRKMEDQGNKNEADYYFYREMEAIRIKNGIKGTENLTWPWKIQVHSYYSSKSRKWVKLVGLKIWKIGRYDLFEYLLIQCIFGYGVHPFRLFAFWILMVFAFASYYWYFDAVEGARAWFDYIWFSIATSATPGYALYNPIGHYKIVTGIEAINGTFMWAAFIATFARKWQR